MQAGLDWPLLVYKQEWEKLYRGEGYLERESHLLPLSYPLVARFEKIPHHHEPPNRQLSEPATGDCLQGERGCRPPSWYDQPESPAPEKLLQTDIAPFDTM
jgi:hypothetical protein